MTAEKMMFCLLRYEICGTPLPEDDRSYQANALFSLSKHHDMAHIIAAGLEENGILTEDPDLKAKFDREKMIAVYREIQLRQMLEEVRRIFREAKIVYVPLKGARLRPMYPEPWMRTSCDLDVLIHENDLARATDLLQKNGFTTDGIRTRHDISFFYNGMHMELHFHVCGNREKPDRTLSQVWKYCVPVDETEYAETEAFFTFHHIAHTAHHFISGGCGIRPIIDLWVLRKNGFYEEKELLPLLEVSGLTAFYRMLCRLAEIWMEGKPYDEVTRKTATYILSGGTYGNYTNATAVGTIRKKQKFRYLWNIAFPTYFYMCTVYPILAKCRILLPFFYVYRVFSKLFGRDRKRVRLRWDAAKSQDRGDVDAVRELFQSVGLKL